MTRRANWKGFLPVAVLLGVHPAWGVTVYELDGMGGATPVAISQASWVRSPFDPGVLDPTLDPGFGTIITAQTATYQTEIAIGISDFCDAELDNQGPLDGLNDHGDLGIWGAAVQLPPAHGYRIEFDAKLMTWDSYAPGNYWDQFSVNLNQEGYYWDLIRIHTDDPINFPIPVPPQEGLADPLISSLIPGQPNLFLNDPPNIERLPGVTWLFGGIGWNDGYIDFVDGHFIVELEGDATQPYYLNVVLDTLTYPSLNGHFPSSGVFGELADSPPLADCNDNEQLDECEIAADPTLDCNLTGTIDACDIAAGTASDVNANGVPDDCEDFEPPTIVGSWQSWKTHGSYGPMARPLSGTSIEVREGSVTDVTIDFSEPMDTNSFGTNDLTVCGHLSGPYHPVSYQWDDADTLRVFFDPYPYLDGNTSGLPNGFCSVEAGDFYIMTLSDNVRDVAGNQLAGDHDTTFAASFGNVDYYNDWAEVSAYDAARVESSEGTTNPRAIIRHDVLLRGSEAGQVNALDTAAVMLSFSEPSRQLNPAIPSCP